MATGSIGLAIEGAPVCCGDFHRIRGTAVLGSFGVGPSSFWLCWCCFLIVIETVDVVATCAVFAAGATVYINGAGTDDQSYSLCLKSKGHSITQRYGVSDLPF